MYQLVKMEVKYRNFLSMPYTSPAVPRYLALKHPNRDETDVYETLSAVQRPFKTGLYIMYVAHNETFRLCSFVKRIGDAMLVKFSQYAVDEHEYELFAYAHELFDVMVLNKYHPVRAAYEMVMKRVQASKYIEIRNIQDATIVACSLFGLEYLICIQGDDLRIEISDPYEGCEQSNVVSKSVFYHTPADQLLVSLHPKLRDIKLFLLSTEYYGKYIVTVREDGVDEMQTNGIQFVYLGRVYFFEFETGRFWCGRLYPRRTKVKYFETLEDLKLFLQLQ